MKTEKELGQFRALDFDEEDILFSSLVRYHFEREAMEDLEKLNAGEFEEQPTQASRKRVEKYYRREHRLRILRHGYHLLQKVSVFLVVLIAGFTYLTISVDAVNRVVVNWLTEVYQTHTHLSIELDDSKVDLSNVKINWMPEGIAVQRLDSSITFTSFTLYYNNQSIGSIICQNHDTNMSLNTEDAKCTYLSLSGFDKVLLIEHEKAISILATKSDIIITIIVTRSESYNFSVGEVITILENIEY